MKSTVSAPQYDAPDVGTPLSPHSDSEFSRVDKIFNKKNIFSRRYPNARSYTLKAELKLKICPAVTVKGEDVKFKFKSSHR